MKKLERKPLSDIIYKALLKKIMDGSIQEGVKLREERLCESLGVSRTPLREAMIRLAREGVLERLPNKGCVVRKRSANEVAELMECRAIFECLALRKWFGSLKRDAFMALRERLLAAKGKEAACVRKEILEVDEEMHALILEACGNSFLKEQILRLQTLCRPYRVFRCDESSDINGIADERLRVIDAIIDGDLERASSALESHFGISAESFSK